MTVDDDLISHLAKLARLAPDDQARERLRDDLANILGMVSKLDELDLDAVQPLRYVTEVEGGLRPDAVGPTAQRDAVLDNAPAADRETGHFKVPRVI